MIEAIGLKGGRPKDGGTDSDGYEVNTAAADSCSDSEGQGSDPDTRSFCTCLAFYIHRSVYTAKY